MSVSVVIFESHYHVSFLHRVVFHCLSLARQSFLHLCLLFFRQLIGELHFKCDEQISVFIILFEEWHAKAFDCFQIVGLDNFAIWGLYSNLSSIEMSQDEVKASQSVQKRDLFFHEQICSFPLEYLVRLFVDLDDNIASFDIGELIGFSMEHILLSMRGAFVNYDFNDFLFFMYLLTIAVLTLVLLADHLSLSSAIFAGSSLLSVHSRAKLSHGCFHALSSASGTG
jgi:hypothetical protein